MQTRHWRGSRLTIQSHNVQLGGHQLELRRCYRSESGPPVVLVADFLQTAGVFLPQKGEGGLAPFLASLGYDVYLAELRGRGESWPGISHIADWGLHEAICEDIPAHLAMLDRLRPGEPQIWMGQGLGAVLLSAVYARTPRLAAPVLAMVHFAAARRHCPESRRQVLVHRCWRSGTGLINLFRGNPEIPFSTPPRRETRQALATWKQWQSSAEWLDPVDGFDYGQALRQVQLPPSLYMANRSEALWGNVADCRRWIGELGSHDGRLVTVGKKGGNQRNYSHAGLLRHSDACEDHFLQLQHWLEEQLADLPPAAVSETL